MSHAATGATPPPAQALAAGLWLRALTLDDVPAVHAMEQRTHAFAWTPGHLNGSLHAGHLAWLLLPQATASASACLGYCVALPGVDEAELLNIVVAPEHQGRGLARHLLAYLAGWCRQAGAATLWLEVREGNTRARQLYERWGFEAVGLRKHYYPVAQGPREHAVVMRWTLPTAQGAGDALD